MPRIQVCLDLCNHICSTYAHSIYFSPCSTTLNHNTILHTNYIILSELTDYTLGSYALIKSGAELMIAIDSVTIY